MQPGVKSRKSWATAFACLYLFVALFSQSFHQHATVITSVASKTIQKAAPAKAVHPGKITDCLSCHFLFDGHAEPPLEFSLQVFGSTQPALISDFSASRDVAELIPHFYRRGPPQRFL